MMPSQYVVVVGPDDLRALIADVVQKATAPLVEGLAAGGRPPPDAGPLAMLTAKEVAALLRVNVRELRRLVREGRFPPPVKVGLRAIRWTRSVVDHAVNGGRP